MSLLEPPQDILRLLTESLHGDADGPPPLSPANDGTEDVLSYVAFLAAGLCEAQEFTADTWKDVLEPYVDQLQQLSSSNSRSTTSETLEKFRAAAEKSVMGDDDQDSYGDGDDEGYEEVCDIRFK